RREERERIRREEEESRARLEEEQERAIREEARARREEERAILAEEERRRREERERIRREEEESRARLEEEQERAIREEARARREEVRAREIGELANQPLPDGFYDSVFNARWSHVLAFPEGEGDAMVVRMEVREGEPPTQLWDYRRKGISYEPVEDAGQFIAPRPRLVILSSAKRWPYSLKQGRAFADCYINREVERVWRVVKGDLEGEFGTADLKGFDVRRRLLIGTPGIGKSMAAGSYLLYRLLHYDAKKLQVVVYCFGGDLAFVF
ncbi:retrotransposon hot spot (RHS) protein, partial [Trypanosoma conorhini]